MKLELAPEDDKSLELCSYRCLRTIGSSQGSSCICVHGDILCGGGFGSRVQVWRHSDATHLATLRAGSGAATQVRALLMIDNKLFSGHSDGTIKVWRFSDTNRTQHSLIASLPTFKDTITRLLPLLRVHSNKNKLRPSSASSVRLSTRHTGAVSALALGDGVVYSASLDGSVKVWSLHQLKFLESIITGNAVTALAALPGGNLLCTATSDSITVWKRKQQQHVLGQQLQETPSSTINALVISSDGSVIYSARNDSSISVWEQAMPEDKHQVPGTFTFRVSLTGHQHAVLCLATVVEDDSLLCSGSADMTIWLWRRTTVEGNCSAYSSLARLRGHTAAVGSVALFMDNRLGCCNVYSADHDNQIKVWRVGLSSTAAAGGQDKAAEESFKSVMQDEENLCDSTWTPRVHWKLDAIKYALEEGAFQLAFQALECC